MPGVRVSTASWWRVMEILWATLLALRRSSSLGSLLGGLAKRRGNRACAIDRLGGGADTLKLIRYTQRREYALYFIGGHGDVVFTKGFGQGDGGQGSDG